MNVATAADIPAFERMMKSGPIVVGMFYLSWCGHCKKAEPSFKDVAARNYPGVNFAMVNSDLKDRTSLRNVQVEGVPDFFVSVPNKGSTNTTIKPEMSYDKPSIERLATVVSNASLADPKSLISSLNNKNSLKPPAFLAINKPPTNMNSLSVQPPSFKNLSMAKKATVGAVALGAAAGVAELAAEEDQEEPINAVSEESTDSEDELIVPNYESSINSRVSINNNTRNVKPAFSLGGDEPTIATTLSITSPIEAARSFTSSLPANSLRPNTELLSTLNKATLAEQEKKEGGNFSMIGGRRSATLRTNTDTLDYNSSSGSRQFDVKIKYYIGKNGQQTTKTSYSFKMNKKTLTADTPSKLQEKIDALLAA